MNIYSLVNFRIRVQISVDGGPYTNYGNPWFRKEHPFDLDYVHRNDASSKATSNSSAT